MNTLHSLKTQARKLRLSALAQSIELRLHEATTHQLPHAEFLELLLQDELLHRSNNAMSRARKSAAFREPRHIAEFDFNFNPNIPRHIVYELATCEFIQQARDVLFIGPPGVGKSHLAQGLGQEAIKRGQSVYYRSIFDLCRDLSASRDPVTDSQVLERYLKPKLLIIDDMGMKNLPERGAEHLLEIIVRRHEVRSTIMTSNRPIEEWGQLLGDVPSATAILDRFLQSATVIQIEGRSHRIARRQSQEQAVRTEAASHSATAPAQPESNAASGVPSARPAKPVV